MKVTSKNILAGYLYALNDDLAKEVRQELDLLPPGLNEVHDSTLDLSYDAGPWSSRPVAQMEIKEVPTFVRALVDAGVPVNHITDESAKREAAHAEALGPEGVISWGEE